jgi:hypothetical protein
MARVSTALKKAQDALAGQRKRATDLRKKITSDKPMNVMGNVAGGYLSGYVDDNNPLSSYEWGKSPNLVIGGAAVLYGLTTSRSGQAEKIITSVGSGMLAVWAYKFQQGQG